MPEGDIAMTVRVPVCPEVLKWALDRSGIPRASLARTFPKLPDWESGAAKPTYNQVSALAKAIHVPWAYLFMSKPPSESISIPDLRTFEGPAPTRPSPDLIDTIHACQDRQEWYRDYALSEGFAPLDFVGSAKAGTSPERTAARMREVVGLDVEAQRGCKSLGEAKKLLIAKMEDAGLLVMVTGIVGNNTRRRLDLEEIRGLALADDYAPLVFVNGRDSVSAQIFMLVHGLAHIWIGSSALSNIGVRTESRYCEEETWCSAVAAEFLVPMGALQREHRADAELRPEISRLARGFRVGKPVMLRRLMDARLLDRSSFEEEWRSEMKRLKAPKKDGKKRQKGESAKVSSGNGGGSFYSALQNRVSRRFASALVCRTLGGETLHREAAELLGVSSGEKLMNVGRSLQAIE